MLGDEGDAKAQTLEAVLKGARDNKLDILEQSLNDAEHGAAGTKINVSVKVKGSMEALVKWLTDLQQPRSFSRSRFFHCGGRGPEVDGLHAANRPLLQSQGRLVK